MSGTEEKLLLAWDANSVHGYVFDTANAVAIRGASDRLKDLDADLSKGRGLKLSEGEILFASGGSGLAKIPRAREDEIVERLHELFADRTLVATCCTATLPYDQAQPFNSLYREVRARLDRERVLRGSDVEASVPFFLERCDVCGRRAAVGMVERGKEQRFKRRECEVCTHAIEGGKKSRYEGSEAGDFSEISDNVRGGFIGVVYIDGNGIGRRLAALPDEPAYREFSQALSRVVKGLFDELVDAYTQGLYQNPIQGGDDLVVVLPGEVAVPFAREFLRRFEEAGRDDPGLQNAAFEGLDPIAASAGVAIGQDGFPIRHLFEEAEDLLKSAKKRVYSDPEVDSALDFAIVTDGSPRQESRTRERLDKEIAVDAMLPTGRPYSLDELDQLRDRLQILRAASIGRTQLFTLQRYADSGPAQLRNHILYQVARSPDWRRLASDLAGGEDVATEKEKLLRVMIPEYSGRRVFDFSDLLELADHWREPDTVETVEKGAAA